jgi:hypothetical protein
VDYENSRAFQEIRQKLPKYDPISGESLIRGVKDE